jgi:hypothetical protein
VTALVVQDLLGGELLVAEVHHANGSHQGVRYWNRFAKPRPPDTSVGRLAAQYDALAGDVARRMLAQWATRAP